MKAEKKKKKKQKKKPETASEDYSEVSTDCERESDEEITLRPGSLQYSEAVKNSKKERKTLILSTSITRDIEEERFNERYSDGNVEIVRLRGSKVK